MEKGRKSSVEAVGGEEALWRTKLDKERRRLHGGRRGERREEAQWRRLRKERGCSMRAKGREKKEEAP